MTKENKPLFEILNNLWLLVKPYVKDEKPYKQIMTDTFNMMVKDRGERYTDEWWKSVVDTLNYPEKYKGTEYVEFAADLAMAINYFWQFDEKMVRKGEKASYHDFMNYVSKAFINEWGKLRDEKKDTQKTAR